MSPSADVSRASLEGGLEVDLKKLTPSCSRCRSKKLKCDTRQPCSNCIAKGLQAECKKDQRIPRGRKRQKPDKTSIRDEILQLRKRLEDLGELLPTLKSPSPSPSPSPSRASPSHDQSATRIAGATSSPYKRPRTQSAGGSGGNGGFESWKRSSKQQPRLDIASSTADVETWTDLERQPSGLATTETPTHAEVVPFGSSWATSQQWRIDSANPYWSNPAVFQERADLTREAFRILPSLEIIEELIDTYFYRCNHLVGNIVGETRFRRLCISNYKPSISPEELLTSPRYVDPSSWAVLCMVLSIALAFYPYDSPAPTEAFHAVNAFRSEKGDAFDDQMDSLAKRCMALHSSLVFTSLPALQGAILMIFRAKGPDTFNRQLLRLAISSAQLLGYHQLGNFALEDEKTVEDRLRKEVVARIWAQLCCRDWCAAERDGTYTIQPLQSTTRAPLHLSEHDILRGETESKPSSVHTQMSYPLLMSSLARIIREVQDARHISGRALDPEAKEEFHQRFLRWLWALPPYFQLDSTITEPGIVLVQRWMLHQQAFHQLLKLCLGDFSDRNYRESLLDLAHTVLITHTRVVSLCPLVKSMWVNWMHLLNAGMIVGFDLLDTESGPKEESHRFAARNKLKGAMDDIVKATGSQRGAMVLQALLDLEQDHHRQLTTCSRDEVEPIHFATLGARLIRIAASKMSESIWSPSSFQNPERGHDALMPGLATNALGDGMTEAIRVDDWRQIAAELGLLDDITLDVSHEVGPNAADAVLGRASQAILFNFDGDNGDTNQTSTTKTRSTSDQRRPPGGPATVTTDSMPAAFTPAFVGGGTNVGSGSSSSYAAAQSQGGSSTHMRPRTASAQSHSTSSGHDMSNSPPSTTPSSTSNASGTDNHSSGTAGTGVRSGDLPGPHLNGPPAYQGGQTSAQYDQDETAPRRIGIRESNALPLQPARDHHPAYSRPGHPGLPPIVEPPQSSGSSTAASSQGRPELVHPNGVPLSQAPQRDAQRDSHWSQSQSYDSHSRPGSSYRYETSLEEPHAGAVPAGAGAIASSQPFPHPGSIDLPVGPMHARTQSVPSVLLPVPGQGRYGPSGPPQGLPSAPRGAASHQQHVYPPQHFAPDAAYR